MDDWKYSPYTGQQDSSPAKPYICRAVLAEKLFSPSECLNIVSIGENRHKDSAEVTTNASQQKRQLSIRKCTVSWIENSTETAWIYERIRSEVEKANKHVYDFDLDFLQLLQYTSYGPFNYFKSHVDSGFPVHAQRKLSISVQLSESRNYFGGNLSVLTSDGKITASRNMGDATIFPSHLVHQAHSVYWGKRNCLVGWYCGNKPLR